MLERLAAELVLAPAADRQEQAEVWLGKQMRTWKVRSGSTARWLAAAGPALACPDELVMFAQYDPVMLLFTLEIWHDGRTVYGIDDWLG